MIAALGVLGTVLITRSLSQEDFGRFTYIFSVLGMLSIVTNLGIGRVAISGLLADGEGRAHFAGNYILLRIALGGVGYLVALGFVAASGQDGQVLGATAVAGVLVIFATASSAYRTVFKAHQRLRGVSIANAVSRVGQFSLVAALAAAGGSLLWFTVPAVLAEVIVLAWIGPAAHRLITITYSLDLRQWRDLLWEAAPLSIAAALGTVYYRVDSIMLAQLDGFSAAAVYGVAYKFVDIVQFIPAALTGASLPVLVATWPGRLPEFRHAVRRAGTILVLVGALVAAEFALFAEPVIRMLFGATYAQGAGAARIVVISQCVAFGTSLAVIVLIAVGRHRRYALVALAGLVLNVALNVVLIPRFSYNGAAVATLTTDLILVVLLLWELTRIRELGRLPFPSMVRVTAAASLAAALGWGLDRVVAWPVAAFGTAVGYGVVVVALRAAGPDGIRGLLREKAPAKTDDPPAS